MIHVLGEVTIGDLPTFLGVFATAGAQARGRHGCQGAEVYAASDVEGKVIVLLAWESLEAFERFANDTAVKATMRSGGMQGPPKFTYVTKIAAFPH